MKISITELKEKRRAAAVKMAARKELSIVRGNATVTAQVERWEAEMADWDEAIADLEAGKIVQASRIANGIALLLPIDPLTVRLVGRGGIYEIETQGE